MSAAARPRIDALHATASASPKAELAAHECFDALRRMGIDPRHSAEGKPRNSWVDAAANPVLRGLC